MDLHLWNYNFNINFNTILKAFIASCVREHKLWKLIERFNLIYGLMGWMRKSNGGIYNLYVQIMFVFVGHLYFFLLSNIIRDMRQMHIEEGCFRALWMISALKNFFFCSELSWNWDFIIINFDAIQGLAILKGVIQKWRPSLKNISRLIRLLNRN